MSAATQVTVYKLGVLGIRGRMGQWVNGLIDTDYEGRGKVVSAPDRGDDLNPLLDCDVVIDFSSPEGTLALIDLCIERGRTVGMVIGSTGFNDAQKQKLQSATKLLPVFVASNFSTGVFLMQKILENFGPSFKRFGYRPAIVETHHIHKKDSPSGTALTLKSALRDSYSENEISVSSIRGGEVIGEHEIRLNGPGDSITFTHRAQDRSIFARGAIEAALWMAERKSKNALPPKQYTMADLFRASTNS